MKVWTTIHIKDQNKKIALISEALTNYIYKDKLDYLMRKYNLTEEDKHNLISSTSNRVMGLLMLYFANNTTRINDIVNKYNANNLNLNIIPEIEGYLEK